MKLSGGLTVLIGSSDAFGLKDYLNYKYQNAAAQGHNAIAAGANPAMQLNAGEINSLLLNVNQQSPNMGYNDMFMHMVSGDKASVLKNMKDNFMNTAYANMQGSKLSPLLLQYAKSGTLKGNHQTLNKESVMYNMMPDPMGTILRLKKHPNSSVSSKAKELLKRMVARGVVTDDPYLPDLLMSGQKDNLKQYLFSKQLQNADPIMQTILYKKLGIPAGSTGPAPAMAATHQKELIQTKLIMDNMKGDSVNQIAPNDAYLMFKFLQTVSGSTDGGKAAGAVPPSVILNVALGNDVAGIKANEFQEKFGVQANDFVCAAHQEMLRVPCMVNQDVVTPGECAAMGCCYNLNTAPVSPSKVTTVPKCYHNLLGKIGAGIAQHLIDDSTITKLFGGQLPQLADLTEAQNWAESQMPDVLRRLVKDEGSYFGNPRGQQSWWDNNYASADKKFNIYATPAPSTRDFEWKAHGPTAMPNAGELEIPEVGGFLTGDQNDRGVQDLDFIINQHMSTVRATLNSESYTCQLIQPEHMVNCFDNNYEALSQWATVKTIPPMTSAEAHCASKGCCFRELNLFDNNPVCYRSLRSGFCDVSYADRKKGEAGTLTGKLKAANDFWTANPYRQQCGAPNISRGECLLNPLCCFDTEPRFEGEPHCYKRGAAESLFDQKTGEMGSQCELTEITQRQNCFDDNSSFGKLLNRMATEDQCIEAGCCYSQAAADAASSMGVLGSMNLAGPHCFKRPSDIDNDLSVADNYNELAKVKVSDLEKVCANDKMWPHLTKREWTQNPTTGRYELSETNTAEPRPLTRQACTDESGQLIMDRHKCIYEQGCCFEKSSDPINPWCYKARLVKKCNPLKLPAHFAAKKWTTC